ncbi:hypothetical protein KW791_01185 [Candidatus Parcubacteria bacterium]|nr:hypothetical protein [Candidatus Parcubacteria bacterium]
MPQHEWTVKQPPLMASSATENREKLFARLESFLSFEYMLEVKMAYILSKEGHRGQPRKQKVAGVPIRYFEHIRDVVLILVDELGIYEISLILTLFLHDCPEDSELVKLPLIRKYFGANVADKVALLTNDFGSSPEGLKKYVKRMINARNQPVLLAKGCDILANVRTWPDKEMAIRQLATKIPAYKAIGEAVCAQAARDYEAIAAQKVRRLIIEALQKKCSEFGLQAPAF